MEALIEGDLVLEDGCLRVDSIHGTDPLLIWPKGFELTVDGRDIRISNDSGVSLSVGQEVRIGGGVGIGSRRAVEQVQQAKAQICQGCKYSECQWCAANGLGVTHCISLVSKSIS